MFAPDLTIRFSGNRLPQARATIVVGLKVSKRSTVRNRTKRILREVIRRHLACIVPGVDLVIYTKPSVVGKEYRALSDQVGRALVRARLLRGPWVDSGGIS